MATSLLGYPVWWDKHSFVTIIIIFVWDKRGVPMASDGIQKNLDTVPRTLDRMIAYTKKGVRTTFIAQVEG